MSKIIPSTRMILFAISLNTIFLQCLNAYTVSEAERHFWVNDHPSRELQAVLQLESITCDGELKNFVNVTKKEWERPKLLEYWDLSDSEKQIARRSEYLRLFSDMDLEKELKPTYSDWDYVLVLGCTAECFVKRLRYALDINNARKTSTQFILLTGSRNLTEQEKTYLKNHFQIENVHTEIDCVKRLAEKLVNGTFKYEVVIHETHLPFSRATTESTLKEWLGHHLKLDRVHSPRCLIISSQPYGIYQLLIAYKVGLELNLPIEWDLGAPGVKAEADHESIKAYLDNIAHILSILQEIADLENSNRCSLNVSKCTSKATG